ncbi:unnamed protein product [Phyllotreta striolata]|uniref:Uncharacterized protein n=1 Tax=Phyllotreta striolata TaxID=444603 RepID=A0A9N9TL16_PHYSR|nr:unnamed protein product [Phyllotreta striolata]
MLFKQCLIVLCISHYSFSFNYNPYCLFEDCKSKEQEFTIPNEYNPYCLLYDCQKTEIPENKPKLPKFWTYNYWTNDEDARTWNEKFACIFKYCKEDNEKIEEQKESYITRTFNNVKSYLNAAKPQDFILKNVLTSEWNPYCWLDECCNEDSLPGNIHKLKELVKQGLYGQHLAETLVEAISSHWSDDRRSSKALVLSFHGSVGTGKNHFSSMIAQSLYKLGSDSKFVHNFSGRLHFSPEQSYKENLYDWLRSNVTACGKQLFIFDEIDHVPSEVLNNILPMLDYREKVDGADYRRAIFIFISNSGSDLIVEKLNELYRGNRSREDMELGDFEKVIVFGIFNQEGGFYHSDTIKHNIIDHYLPFLPLEVEHVKACIVREFKDLNVDEPSEEHVNAILNSLDWIETDYLKYAKSGCKTVRSKVSYFYNKHYETTKKKHDLFNSYYRINLVVMVTEGSI